MLSHLSIHNLAIADQVNVEFQNGLNIITGETGAGKSMLVDALNLVLGERADKSIIRSGESQCRVDASFFLKDSCVLDSLLEEVGLAPCEDGMLVIRRVISNSGSGRIIVNDTPATLQLLKRLGRLLVDMHGPHEHQSLLEASFQRDILDAYCHLGPDRQAFSESYRSLLALKAEHQRLNGPSEDTAARLDLLAFQIRELEDAELDKTDEEELRQEHTRLANTTRILELSESICHALIEGETAAFESLAGVRRLLPELAEMIPEGQEWKDELESISIQINELSSAIQRTAAHTEADPERLQWLEDRMALLQKLKRKYGPDIPSMQGFYKNAVQQYQDLSGRGERLAALEQEMAAVTCEMEKRGTTLTHARTAGAEVLSKTIAEQLNDLGFAQSLFHICLQPSPPGPEGMDRVEFGFAPNVGESMRPLKDIASSGEISRVMLAIKAVLAEHDSVPILVFDEIDANLGGETGGAVGRKLAATAATHQIICITHLPQVAVYGQTHLVVEKGVHNGRTRMVISTVDGEMRTGEIARMLGGERLTSVTLKHASEMLQRARSGEGVD